ncbi:MAG: response regulator [Proteobacteria bacterium]|nr:response regulator [Pseudomonadota bacterium]MBI3496693.1 response regulator [Pseudomonadota bacterium]
MPFPAIKLKGSIGAKIFAAFVAMALMLGMLGVYGIYVLSEAGDIVAYTYDRPLMALNYARSASQVFTEMDKELLRRSAVPDSARPEIDRHVEELARNFAGDLAVAEERALSDQERSIIWEIRRLAAEWMGMRESRGEAGSEPELDHLAEMIINRFDLLTELTAEHAFVERRQGISAIARFKYISIGALLLALLFGAAITMLLAGRIIRPLSEAAKIADRIAGGELRTPIPVGGMDETGILLRSMTVMQDNIRIMMERETAQRRSAQNRLIDALESSHEGMVLVDAEGRIVIANSQMVAFFPSVEPNFFEGAEFDTAFAAMRACLKGDDGALQPAASGAGGEILEHGGEVQLVDGRWVRVSRTNTHDGGFFLFLSDFTEIKDRADMLRAVMDTIPDGLVILAEELGAVFWNRGFLRLCGLAAAAAREAEALQGRTIEGLLRRFGLEPAAVVDMETTAERAMERTLADGRSVRFQVLKVGGGSELLWVSDTTERRRQERDKLALQERVLQTQKSDAIGAIVGTVAHDFNNLLTAIMGFASLSKVQLDLLMAMPEKLQARDPETMRVIMQVVDAAVLVAKTHRDIVDGATRGQRIVQNLTEFVKARKGESAVGDIMTTVREARKLIAIALPSSVALEVEGAESVSVARHDRVTLEQVLLNLCLNGAYALGGRPGRIRVRVQTVRTDGRRAEVLRAEGAGKPENQNTVAVDDTGWVHVWRGVIAPGPYVRIDVSDDGSGMDQEKMSRIFETFFTTKPKGVGTGLGLASVASIMDSHGGAIHVRSRPGHGTTFSLFLHAASETEIVAPGDGAAVAAEARATSKKDVRKGARIVVVDDEQSLARLMEMTLTDQGYVVERFTDSLLAVDRLKRDPETVDLVVTDQTMPGITGVMLAEQMAMVRRNLPVLLCTGYSAEHIDDHELPQGVSGVLRKPYKPEELAERVRRMLAS